MKNMKLATAVLVTIQELENVKSFSAYDVTKKIREKCNNQEWEISDAVAEEISGVDTFIINHDDVRALVVDLYENGALSNWNKGYSDPSYGASYIVYSLVRPLVANPIISHSNTNSVKVATPTKSTCGHLAGFETQIHTYINNRLAKGGAKPTIKQIQSRLKTKGITSKDLCTYLLGTSKYIVSLQGDLSKSTVYV